MRSAAVTVDEYLESLADDRREALGAVRRVVLAKLPKGYEEAMNWGMISYQVPLHLEPDTYNDQPLLYAALGSQKHHMAIYLTAVYADDVSAAAFKDAYEATGKKPNMGKSCVRFRHVDDLPLDLIGATIEATSVEDFIALVSHSRSER